MSIKTMHQVWEDTETSGTVRLVLLALADSANDDGYCWPSLTTIARKCNCSRRYVVDIINGLIGRGYIQRRRRPGTSTMYIITIPKSNSAMIAGGNGASEAGITSGDDASEAGITSDDGAGEAGITRLVRQASLGSEAGITRLVRQASLKPLINRNEPSINHKGGAREAESSVRDDGPLPRDDDLLVIAQTLTGIMAAPDDVMVVDRWQRDGVTADDLREALRWRVENNRPPLRVIRHLDGGVRMARLKRIQRQAGRSPVQDKWIPEDHATEVW